MEKLDFSYSSKRISSPVKLCLKPFTHFPATLWHCQWPLSVPLNLIKFIVKVPELRPSFINPRSFLKKDFLQNHNIKIGSIGSNVKIIDNLVSWKEIVEIDGKLVILTKSPEFNLQMTQIFVDQNQCYLWPKFIFNFTVNGFILNTISSGSIFWKKFWSTGYINS